MDDATRLLYEECHKRFKYVDGKLCNRYDLNVMAKKNALSGCLHHSGYTYIAIDKKTYGRHRLIYLMHHKTLPEVVDHKDRDNTNDVISNLRPATQTKNKRNSKIRDDNTTGYKGVKKHIRTNGILYEARIFYNKKSYYLGVHPTAELAADAYNKKAIELHGEFAFQNEIL